MEKSVVSIAFIETVSKCFLMFLVMVLLLCVLLSDRVGERARTDVEKAPDGRGSTGGAPDR